MFLTLEDETGIANIIVRPDVFTRERLMVIEEPFLVIGTVLQQQVSHPCEPSTSTRCVARRSSSRHMTSIERRLTPRHGLSTSTDRPGFSVFSVIPWQ